MAAGQKKYLTHEVIPSASRLSGTMRDVGYDFRTAVADLVDNSIAAGARKVAITMSFEGKDSWIRVADDGTGMDADALTEAMRYGSRRSYEEDELGKFGIGLKSASTSQCRRLTVASRTSEAQRRIYVRRWDLDEIQKTDQWYVEELEAADCGPELTEPLERHPGCVVLWQKLDRILDYRFPDGESARKGFFLRAEELEKHLGMVFHRFLAGEARKFRRPLKITVNDEPVEAWDPFARSEKHTEALRAGEYDIDSADGSGTVRVAGYVLPSKDRFSSVQAFERLSGPEKWNKQQGLYIYRNDRMIQSGGWSWMRTSDEHTKLARVSIDFGSRLDSAFKVNMAKERVTLPGDFRDELKSYLDVLIRRAQNAYRKDEPVASSSSTLSDASPVGTPSKGYEPVASSHSSGASPSREGARHFAPAPGPGQIRKALEKAARETRSLGELRKLVAEVRRASPEVAHALGY